MSRKFAFLTKKFQIEAAHSLPNVPTGHQCARLHGHSFVIELTVKGPVGEQTGWVVDFADVKKAFKPIFDTLDHNHLNTVPGLQNPTSENLAFYILENFNLEGSAKLHSVQVFETCNSGCTVYADDNNSST